MRKDTDALDDLRGAVLHQAIVSGDIRLALCGVDFIPAAQQFITGREACTAKASYAKLVDTFDQFGTGTGAIVAPAVALNPAVFAVSINNDAQFGQRRRMRG